MFEYQGNNQRPTITNIFEGNLKFSFPIKMIYEVLWNKSTEMGVTRRTRFLWDKVCFHDELSQINELVKVQIVTKIVTTNRD